MYSLYLISFRLLPSITYIYIYIYNIVQLDKLDNIIYTEAISAYDKKFLKGLYI